MDTENEIRFLEVDEEELIKKLETLGAEKILDHAKQVRYVYDLNPKQPNKWIRLRTNGTKTTLTVKELQNTTVDGTKECEIEVSDFEKTNLLLNELGFLARSKQENIRTLYKLFNVEVAIDSWPKIPTYVELEGKTKEEIFFVGKILNLDAQKLTTLDVASIYQSYGIDVLKIKDLTFGDKNNGVN